MNDHKCGQIYLPVVWRPLWVLPTFLGGCSYLTFKKKSHNTTPKIKLINSDIQRFLLKVGVLFRWFHHGHGKGFFPSCGWPDPLIHEWTPGKKIRNESSGLWRCNSWSGHIDHIFVDLPSNSHQDFFRFAVENPFLNRLFGTVTENRGRSMVRHLFFASLLWFQRNFEPARCGKLLLMILFLAIWAKGSWSQKLSQ